MLLLILLLTLLGFLLYLFFKVLRQGRRGSDVIVPLPIVSSEQKRELVTQLGQRLERTPLAYMTGLSSEKLAEVSRLAYLARGQIYRLLLPQNIVGQRKTFLGKTLLIAARTEDRPFLNMLPYILYKYFREYAWLRGEEEEKKVGRGE